MRMVLTFRNVIRLEGRILYVEFVAVVGNEVEGDDNQAW